MPACHRSMVVTALAGQLRASRDIIGNTGFAEKYKTPRIPSRRLGTCAAATSSRSCSEERAGFNVEVQGLHGVPDRCQTGRFAEPVLQLNQLNERAIRLLRQGVLVGLVHGASPGPLDAGVPPRRSHTNVVLTAVATRYFVATSPAVIPASLSSRPVLGDPSNTRTAVLLQQHHDSPSQEKGYLRSALVVS